MAKFKITINEVVSFGHEMIVEAKSEGELDKILEERGIKVLEFKEDGSGDVQIEIPDLFEIQ